MNQSADDHDGMLRYDQLAARVYGERRMPTGTRDLILALGWVILRDPRRHDPTIGPWARAREVLNADSKRMWKLLANDAPRYEHDWHGDPQGCQAPMVRRAGACGRRTVDGFAERDMATGRFRLWGFCSRPRCQQYGSVVYERAQVANEKAPEAIPDTGGLLPLFFEGWDWAAKYSKANPQWKQPSYGLSADEWPPVPGDEPVLAFPKLRLVASNGEIVDRRELTLAGMRRD